ncbi:MAG: hypothetical protein ACOH5I_09250 [Oligoflexus sp.]
MCIICLEFNKNRDLLDAKRMVEAARRESDVIPEQHLKEVEEKLQEYEKEAMKIAKP